jgi:hypothetical protein
VLLVEADDAECAVEIASDFAWNNCAWSDWSERGGRYTDYLPAPIEGGIPAVARYVDHPAECETLLFSVLTTMNREQASYLEKLGHLTVGEVYRRGSNPRPWEQSQGIPYEESDLYLSFYVRRLMNSMFSDEHHSDTYVFDVMTYHAGLRYFRERLTTKPSQQFLVVWDFHY